MSDEIFNFMMWVMQGIFNTAVAIYVILLSNEIEKNKRR